jgi:hypothetical protein
MHGMNWPKVKRLIRHRDFLLFPATVVRAGSPDDYEEKIAELTISGD